MIPANVFHQCPLGNSGRAGDSKGHRCLAYCIWEAQGDGGHSKKGPDIRT